jgi:hypothetical protein
VNSLPHIASIVEQGNEIGAELGDIGCSVCQMIVTWAQSQLTNNRSADDIKDYLDKVKFGGVPTIFKITIIKDNQRLHFEEHTKKLPTINIVSNEASYNKYSVKRSFLLTDVFLMLLQMCERLPNPSGAAAVDCATIMKMPTVTFRIGGKSFDLAPEEVCEI